MGLEQGTTVPSSGIDLLPPIDLPDLRLPRAFKAWTKFQTRYQPEIAVIKTLSPNERVALGDELSISISQAIGMEVATNQLRGLDQEKVRRLSESVSGNGNRIIFMRHGEQSPPEWISSISDPAIRKIRMMQNPFNREDSLTNRGFVDVFITAFGLLYLQETIQRRLSILSSENTRAKEIAEIVSKVIPGTTFATDERLNSIAYKDEYDDPSVTLEQLLEKLPSGVMPWDPELVDKLCKKTRSGLSQSEVIINVVVDLMKHATAMGSNNLLIVFTHTQQLAEVLRSTNSLQDPDMRFPELTMLVSGQDQTLQILPRGILTEQDISQRYQLPLFNL